MNTIIAFIFMFGLLVFIHELGHLIFAKRAGMLAREFAIGFGPKIFSHRKDETLYTIRMLPIGGYVRVAGDDPEIVELKPGYHIGIEFNEQNKVNKIIVNNKSNHPNAKVVEVEQIDLDHDLTLLCHDLNTEERQQYDIDRKALFVMDEKTLIAPYDRQFGSKSVGKKAMQVFAGPLMNFLLAIAIFWGLGFIQGVPVEEASLGSVQDGSPAEQAELMEGDTITSIDGKEINDWTEFVLYVQERPGEEIALTADRDGQMIEASLVTNSFETETGEMIGRIGVKRDFDKAPLEVFSYGFTQVYEIGTLILNALGMLVTGQLSLDALAGPVGIYTATDEVVQTGILNFFMWTAMLSINLGIVNLLPLPALDGGRLMFLGYEAIRGKPLDPQKEGIFHFIGFALLMLLMIAVTWNDIERLFM